jgi:hypothetical protein
MRRSHFQVSNSHLRPPFRNLKYQYEDIPRGTRQQYNVIRGCHSGDLQKLIQTAYFVLALRALTSRLKPQVLKPAPMHRTCQAGIDR